jgi:hypothetical protein
MISDNAVMRNVDVVGVDCDAVVTGVDHLLLDEPNRNILWLKRM